MSTEAKDIGREMSKLTRDNYVDYALTFRDRQAGVSVVYDPELDRFFYNAYCLETKIMKELFTCECEFLDDALALVNSEFGTWELTAFATDKGCGNCVAKS